MGYTHYWDSVSLLNDEYRAAVEDCIAIVRASPVPLVNGMGEKGTKPELSVLDGIVRFNGAPPDDFETFEVRPLGARDFCKTGFMRIRPYDIVVVACLARLAEAGLSVRSDGDPKDWADGIAFASKVLGRDILCPIKER